MTTKIAATIAWVSTELSAGCLIGQLTGDAIAGMFGGLTVLGVFVSIALYGLTVIEDANG